jgi:hypothetical protein
MGLPRPNPASSSFSIPILLEEPGEWRIGVYDLAGRLVHTVQGASPVSELLEIDVTGLSPGVYFLRMTGPETVTRRLAVVR